MKKEAEGRDGRRGTSLSPVLPPTFGKKKKGKTEVSDLCHFKKTGVVKTRFSVTIIFVSLLSLRTNNSRFVVLRQK